MQAKSLSFDKKVRTLFFVCSFPSSARRSDGQISGLSNTLRSWTSTSTGVRHVTGKSCLVSMWSPPCHHPSPRQPPRLPTSSSSPQIRHHQPSRARRRREASTGLSRRASRVAVSSKEQDASGLVVCDASPQRVAKPTVPPPQASHRETDRLKSCKRSTNNNCNSKSFANSSSG